MKARRPPWAVSTAPSSRGASSGLANASRNTASISVWVALPPEPCDRVIRSSLSLALRARAFSIRWSTCSSRLSSWYCW